MLDKPKPVSNHSALPFFYQKNLLPLLTSIFHVLFQLSVFLPMVHIIYSSVNSPLHLSSLFIFYLLTHIPIRSASIYPSSHPFSHLSILTFLWTSIYSPFYPFFSFSKWSSFITHYPINLAVNLSLHLFILPAGTRTCRLLCTRLYIHCFTLRSTSSMNDQSHVYPSLSLSYFLDGAL